MQTASVAEHKSPQTRKQAILPLFHKKCNSRLLENLSREPDTDCLKVVSTANNNICWKRNVIMRSVTFKEMVD